MRAFYTSVGTQEVSRRDRKIHKLIVEFKKDLLTRIIQNLENTPGIAPHDVMV